MSAAGFDEIKIEAKIFCFDTFIHATGLFLLAPKKKDGAGFPHRLECWCRGQTWRSSGSTLGSLWLSSASADTAIDRRVDSAWLLAFLVGVGQRLVRRAGLQQVEAVERTATDGMFTID